MTIERLRDAISQQPFRPFMIHTADGRSFRVPHPDFVSFHPKSERICIVWDPERVDAYRVLDLLLVASLDFAGQEPGSENGASHNGS